MSYVLTYVSSSPDKPLTHAHIKQAEEVLNRYDTMQTSTPVWLSESKAVDIGIAEEPKQRMMSNLQSIFTQDQIDVFVSRIDRRRKKLLLADMDSTIVTSETLDDLAEFAGLKQEISEITKEAMEGRIDFRAAVKKRVGLLEGLPLTALESTLENIQLSPGAKTLVSVMRKNNAYCVLVSGGFTFFTEEIAKQAGFQQHHGNELDIDKDQLTGKVIEPIQDKYAKLEYLKAYTGTLKISAAHCLAIGDGANDLPMLKAAGLGIGYRPKDVVYKEIPNLIIYGDLSTALYAQGYTEENIQNAMKV